MRLLILDDAARTDLAAMSAAAENLGHEVAGTADPDGFLDAARTRDEDFQGYVVDYSVPSSTSTPGVRSGPDAVALAAAAQRPVPTVFVTNFPPDCDKRMREYDPRLPVRVVAKPTTASSAAWVETMEATVQCLEELAERQPETAPLGTPLDAIGSSYFQAHPNELLALSTEERDRLEIQAADELDGYLDPVWEACDDEWVMVQRIGDQLVVVSRGSDDELPSVESLREMEFEREAPVLLVGRPSLIEEADGPIDCSPRQYKNWKRYPFIRLILGSEEREFHFDTGSPTSYISHEFVSQFAPVPEGAVKRSKLMNLAGRRENVSEVPLSLPLHVAGPEGNVGLSVRMRAVKDWHDMKLLNPTCEGQRCPRSAFGQCGRRLGLIGRNTLYAFGGGVWQLDPRSGQIYAVNGVSPPRE